MDYESLLILVFLALPFILLALALYLFVSGRRRRKPLQCVFGVVLGSVCLWYLYFANAPISPGRSPAKQAACTQNLNSIGKALRMYAADWDDKFPTNRRKGTKGTFLSNSCSLSKLSKEKASPDRSCNFVEALSPYLEKLEDLRSSETIWRCPAVRGPAASSGVTYCMNWYMAEQKESEIDDLANTLLMRELGKRMQEALLRPYPLNPPDDQHPRGSGPPVHVFPCEREFCADTVGPAIHSNGSMVLFVDGHVAYRSVDMLNVGLVSEKIPNGTGRWRVGDTKYGGIWITP